MKCRVTLPAFLLACALPALAGTQVITLNYRMAGDMLDVAQSVVGNQGRVSAHGNQLIVNAPDAVIAELRDVLSQLDQAPRRLLISVDTQDSGNSSARGYALEGSARAGNVEIIAGRGEVQGRDQVRIIRHNTQSRDGGVQQVQATEGYPAFITTGQSVPVTNTQVDAYGQVYRSTQYQDLNRGFYATADVLGERVQITLSSRRDRLSRSQPGAIDFQGAETRVSGRLGEWIDVGGIDESASSTQDGTFRRYSTQGQQDYRLRLKVDVLD